MQGIPRKYIVRLVVAGCLGFLVVIAVLVVVAARMISAQVRSLTNPPPLTIPAKPDSYTSRRFHADLLDFTRRAMVEPYQRVGVRSPAWDAEATRYLEENARVLSSQPGAPGSAQLLAEGKALVDRGCTDPMVLFCYGAALQDAGRPAQAEAFLVRAVKGFEQQAYPRTFAFLAPQRLGQLCLEDGRVSEADRWFALTRSWIGQAGGEVRDQGRDPQCFLELLVTCWDSLESYSPGGVYQALKPNSRTPEYVTNVTGGWTQAARAWQVLGPERDYPEGFRQAWKLQSELTAAQSQLTRAWKRHPEFPEAPAAMIEVAAEIGGVNAGLAARLWFTRAVSAQLDYEPAYESFVRALRNRGWSGEKQVVQLAQACLDTGRFDTQVPRWYLRALGEAAALNDYDTPDLYQRGKQMCDAYLQAASMPEERDYYQTLLAALAWRTQHYREARQAFDALGARAQPAAFTDYAFGADLSKARAQTYARTGPAAKLVAEGDQRRRADDGKARDQYQAALRLDRNAYADAYLRYQLADIEATARYARGEWADLIIGPGARAYRQNRGQWEREPDGALRGTTGPDGLLLLKPGLGERVELEGEIEYVTVPCRNAGRASIVVNSWRDHGRTRGARVVISRTEGQVTLVDSAPESVVARIPVPVGQKVQFRVKSWDAALAVYIDGKLVHPVVRVVPHGRSSGADLALGSDYRGPGAVYRFRHLRVRKL